jgi:hypothetical protein
MEITLVGLYADTSLAWVSMIGNAVKEPPPFTKGRIDSGKSGKITKPMFLTFWRREFQNLDLNKRIFKVLAKAESPDYIL